jgi:hypothetical protein
MSNNQCEAIGTQHAVRKLLLSGGLALALVGLLVVGLGAVQAHAMMPSAPRAASTLDRFEDPVVITGSQFPAFSGVPLRQLVLYAYRGGDWQAVPFQIDEVNISGTYVISDGGLLDANDELVFMAGDAGGVVSTAAWPADAQARLHARYAITVSDPLSVSQQAWVYLYRSATLTRSQASYVTWTQGLQTASALSYTAAFSPTRFVGLSDLFIDGRNVDILDRQKIRIELLGGFIKFNEEGLVSLNPATLTLPITGPIRAVTNEGDLRAAFYRSQIAFDVRFDLSSLGVIVPDFIRTSFDWNNPITTGLTTYYDSNTPGGVAIDGAPDVVSTTPPIDWFQVNGGAAGPGGLVMTIPRVDPHGGTVINYYKDNSATDANDTGDLRSYGDSGLRINGPFGSPAIISFTLMAYILPPGSNTNVGASYFARANSPLSTNAAQESYLFVLPANVAVTGATLARVDEPQTYVASVNPITATLPITYVWQAADHSPITVSSGLSSSATFTWTTFGLKDVSVIAFNIGGLASSDPLSVLVGRPTFLPLILKSAP